VNIIKSHHLAASSIPKTFNPSASAFFADGEFSLNATAMFFAPLSLKLMHVHALDYHNPR